MRKTAIYAFGAVIAACLAFGGCKKQAHQVHEAQGARQVKGGDMESFLDSHHTHADSLVLETYRNADYKRMLVVVDSLSAAGELSELRIEGYRAVAYSELQDAKRAIACLHRAIAVKDPSDKDYFLIVYLKTVYAELQQLKGNSEGALRTALALVEQMRNDGYENNEVCQRIYSVLGNVQLNMDRPDEAAKSFEQGYAILKNCIKNDSTGNHLMEGVETLNVITSTYIDNRQWDMAELWLNRLDSVFTLCQSKPYAAEYPSYTDWYLASIDISRAMILEVHGKKAEAYKNYQDFLTTDFSKTKEGLMIGCDYLILSQRYAEAADNYVVADQVMSAYEFEPNLQAIGSVLMPKLRANYYAGRKDSALRVAMQIAELYDTALVKQKRDATAEMATVYDVEGKERMIAEREAKISQQRFIVVTILLVALTIFFVIFTWVRYRIGKMKAKQERIDS
jgi:tetratricopeptide (TPR) repeat protein